MRRSMPRIVVALAALLQVAAQQPAGQPTFRVTSDRVLVEFVAVDKDSGEFILDLDKNELELTVDGKKQRIDVLIPPQAPRSDGSAAVSGSPPRTVILLDSRVIDAGNFVYAVGAIRKFVAESLQADHQVMLAEIDRGLKILTPLTRDRAVLLAALDQLKPATAVNPLDRIRSGNQTVNDYLDALQQQVTHLRQGLTLICHSLSAMPGSKHVVFFSEGYPLDPAADLEFESRQSVAYSTDNRTRMRQARKLGATKDPGVLPMLQQVVGLANNFGINFYTVDARGLSAVPGLSAEVSGSLPDPDMATFRGTDPPPVLTDLTSFNLSTLTNLDSAHNTLVALAGGTNGAAFYNSNNLEAVLHASAREQQMAYLVAFEPRGLKDKNKGRFRRLHVKTSRKSVSVRSQVGYLDTRRRDASAVRLGIAFERPDLFRHLTPIIDIAAQPGGADVVFGLPGPQVVAQSRGDKQRIDLSFLGRVYDLDGKPVADDFQIARAFQTDLSPEQFAQISRDEVLGSQQVKLPAGRYRLVLAAEDRVAGSLGVSSSEFEVP